MRLPGLVFAAVSSLAGGWACPAAAAQSACADLGGTVGPDQICHGHVVTADYTLDLSCPDGYPDQQPLADYLRHTRDEWMADTRERIPRDRPPYLLTISGTAYRSSAPTASVVLDMNQDFGAHPVTSYKAFNYDLGRRAPITFDTLFKPATRPVDTLNPAVARELGPSPFGAPGSDAYQNFAITDDAVIFFFGQGEVLPAVNGPQQVSVPRSVLAPMLAV